MVAFFNALTSHSARPLLLLLLQVAADPNTLYPILIDSPAVSTLSGLLSHDNTDIAVEVLDLLQELTDAGGCGQRERGKMIAAEAFCLHKPLCMCCVADS